MIELNLTDLQCIRRALTDFIKTKENSAYSFPYYTELNARINNAIYSEENNKLPKKDDKIKELEEKIGILEVKLEKANILLFQVIEEDENENIIVDYETIKKKIHLYFNFKLVNHRPF